MNWLLKYYRLIILAGILAVFILSLVNLIPRTTFKRRDIKLLHRSEGIMGQITVLEYPDSRNRTVKSLMVNNIGQSKASKGYEPFSDWGYVHRLSILSNLKYTPQSKVLLLGLGGGMLAMELVTKGFKDIDVVEIDGRLPDLDQEFFGFRKNYFDIYIDDGRNFINKTEETYDLVIIDVCAGEVQPVHMFTIESFNRLQQITSPDALLIINFQGFLTGANGRAARSIAKTLESVGYQMNYFFKGDDQTAGDLLLVASLSNVDFDKIQEADINPCCRAYGIFEEGVISDIEVDLSDGIVLTDNFPILEMLQIEFIEQWRRGRIEEVGQLYLQHRVDLFD